MLELLINEFLDFLSSPFNIFTNENDASFELSKVGITFKVKRRKNLIPEGVGSIIPLHDLVVDAGEMLFGVFEHFDFEQIRGVPEESESFVSHVDEPK